MASQRRTDTNRAGRQAHTDAGRRSGNVIRTDSRVERFVSISSGDNNNLGRWLAETSRANHALKTARNLGGLSLTLVESRQLEPALRKRYADYGRYIGTTMALQRELQDRVAHFIAGNNWVDTHPALDRRLHFFGGNASRSPGTVHFRVTDREIVDQREKICDYLVYEEGLDLNPSREFVPHITIDTVFRKDMDLLRYPEIPRDVLLTAPALSCYAQRTPR